MQKSKTLPLSGCLFARLLPKTVDEEKYTVSFIGNISAESEKELYVRGNIPLDGFRETSFIQSRQEFVDDSNIVVFPSSFLSEAEQFFNEQTTLDMALFDDWYGGK